MQHIHFETLHSTQIYLRDNLTELQSKSADVLITTDDQTQGIGRNRNTWDFYPKSIAMSFTLSPHAIPTLTPLEIGVLVSIYFEEKWGIPIFIKWPNDLLTKQGLKCGGIITQYVNSQTAIAGLGLNLFQNSIDSVNLKSGQYTHGIDAIFDNESYILNKLNSISFLARDFYEFILSRRIFDSRELKVHFFQRCYHINKKVSIEDDGFEFEGAFLGIGDNGEALVDVEGKTKAFLSSSLKIIVDHLGL